MNKRDRLIWDVVKKDRSFQLALILPIVFIGIGIGFLFAGIADYSWVLFILLPIVLGFAVGSLPARKNILIAVLISAVCSLIAIYIPGLSGFICVVMAVGLVLPCI